MIKKKIQGKLSLLAGSLYYVLDRICAYIDS